MAFFIDVAIPCSAVYHLQMLPEKPLLVALHGLDAESTEHDTLLRAVPTMYVCAVQSHALGCWMLFASMQDALISLLYWRTQPLQIAICEYFIAQGLIDAHGAAAALYTYHPRCEAAAAAMVGFHGIETRNGE